jgi:hypothetical protein
MSTHNHKVLCSRDSIRGFIKMFLGIEATPYWYHQTLTFRKGINLDVTTAHLKLKKLLDSLVLAFPDMGCFFLRGYQQSGEVHFHAILIFFGERTLSPEMMLEDFTEEVFSRWQKLNGGKLKRRGNEMHLRQKNFQSIEYLLRHVEPSAQPLARQQHWHGVRNGRLLAQHSLKVSGKEVSAIYNKCFLPKFSYCCHRADQNQPLAGTSKPASLRREFHCCFLGFFKWRPAAS